MARNTVWNLVGQAAPLFVALVAIPRLVHGLGTERFGVLPLAWTIIGYFGLFDMGLGRALTKLVAEKLARHEDSELPGLVWTALILMLLLGVAGGIFAAVLFPWLARAVLKIPPGLQSETIQAFYIIAASIPIVVSTAGFRGLLEAFQRFDLVNLLRIPLGVVTYLAPLLVLPFSHRLGPIMAALVVGRLLAWVAHGWLCFHVMPSLRQGIEWQRKVIAPLLRFGSWMTVSNLISPFMVYMDRFIIGALMSLTAVAYYAIPYELSTKLLLIPGALATVLFPGFSASLAQDQTRTTHLFDRSVNYILLFMFPVTLVMAGLAHPGLQIWLGPDFAQNGAPVLQWLVVGTFMNAIAFVPFALLQGGGRPDLTAKLHVAELPFYLLALWWLIRNLGITGAAIAWAGRVSLDMLILFFLAARMLPDGRPRLKKTAFIAGLMLVAFAMATLPESVPMELLFLTVTLFVFVVLSWFFVLRAEERIIIQKLLRSDLRALGAS